MRTEPNYGLTPRLERQLARLEAIGNAEADLQTIEDASRSPSARITSRVDEQNHRLSTLKLRYAREAERTRRLAVVLLVVSPIVLVVSQLTKAVGYDAVATILFLLAGVLLGLSLPALYYANKRLQELA